METGGEALSSEDEFIQPLGLVDPEAIERARELLDVYRHAIAEVSVEVVTDEVKDSIHADHKLEDDLKIDSLGIVEIIQILEDRTGLSIETEKFEDVKTAAEGYVAFYNIVEKR